jgi:hypothetical protein
MVRVGFHETLHGGFYLLADPVDERAADLELDIEVPRLRHLVPSLTARLVGQIRLEGFADSPVTGKIVIVPDQKRGIYELAFTGQDGAPYRFRGQKELLVLNLGDALTLLEGSIYDSSAGEIGRLVARFDVRGNLGSLLRSIRVHWGEGATPAPPR